jgi:hypothetical protein
MTETYYTISPIKGKEEGRTGLILDPIDLLCSKLDPALGSGWELGVLGQRGHLRL